MNEPRDVSPPLRPGVVFDRTPLDYLAYLAATAAPDLSSTRVDTKDQQATRRALSYYLSTDRDLNTFLESVVGTWPMVYDAAIVDLDGKAILHTNPELLSKQVPDRPNFQIVQDAGRPNGGLLIDIWHHRRSGSDDELLSTIPADRIYSVQLSDGAATPEGTLLEDLQRRRLPGEGDFDVVAFIRRLDAMGVTCPIGIEVFDAVLVGKGAPEATRVLHDALAAVVAEARS